jgi:adenylylsulfate kinase
MMNKTVTKALSWRILGTAITFGLVYALTGRMDIAAIVCGFEVLVKLAVYFLHERVWDKIFPVPKDRQAFVLWFTGLSGSGKSTIANVISSYLEKKGRRVERLDGDTVRSIFPDTGFTREARNSHIRRIGYLASILEKNGIAVVSSFISPYAESRDFVRTLCRNFIEVYLSTPLEACERRDVKGLYRRARTGEIANFTGIGDPYEPPPKPEIIIDTEKKSIDETVEIIISYLEKYL